MSHSEDELRDKRRELELSLANQYQMSEKAINTAIELLLGI